MTKRRNPAGTPFSDAIKNLPGKSNSQIPGEKGRGDDQYKDIVTRVNNREYFDDDYEVKQENQISRDEAKREKESRAGRRRRR